MSCEINWNIANVPNSSVGDVGYNIGPALSTRLLCLQPVDGGWTYMESIPISNVLKVTERSEVACPTTPWPSFFWTSFRWPSLLVVPIRTSPPQFPQILISFSIFHSSAANQKNSRNHGEIYSGTVRHLGTSSLLGIPSSELTKLLEIPCLAGGVSWIIYMFYSGNCWPEKRVVPSLQNTLYTCLSHYYADAFFIWCITSTSSFWPSIERPFVKAEDTNLKPITGGHLKCLAETRLIDQSNETPETKYCSLGSWAPHHHCSPLLISLRSIIFWGGTSEWEETSRKCVGNSKETLLVCIMTSFHI